MKVSRHGKPICSFGFLQIDNLVDLSVDAEFSLLFQT